MDAMRQTPPRPQPDDQDTNRRPRLVSPNRRATAGAEPAPRQERIHTPLNPEDESLPGNARWYTRVFYAAERKWVQFNAWDQSYYDRFHSRRLGRKAEGWSGRVEELRRQRAEFDIQQTRHQLAIAQIKNSKSWMGKNVIGRWIKDRRIRYHSRCEQRNSRKSKRFKAKIERSEGQLKAAQTGREWHDELVVNAVTSAEKRLNKRLEPLKSLRERIDKRMNFLGDSITHHEETVKGFESDIARLEDRLRTETMTESERQAFLERYRQFHENLAREESALEDAKELFDRCGRHRMRLESAEEIAEGARDGITERYEDYDARKQKNRAERAQSRANASTPSIQERTLTDIDLVLENEEVSNQDFGKLWNLAFPRIPIKDYRDFFTMFDQIDLLTNDEAKQPETKQKFSDFMKALKKLYAANTRFKEMVRLASGETGNEGFRKMANSLKFKYYYNNYR